ncbi:MAG TPA: Rrf2 family transcriptional regulator [Bacteroidales bacterium]|nr:Rrf2 family transcriptional regulator [Bacteroidales bacterium]
MDDELFNFYICVLNYRNNTINKMAKIFTLSEASHIAIHSMILILNSPIRLNANNIADRLGASRHHTSKVLQRLVKDQMLSSGRGPSGGFNLLKKSDEITFYEIYKSIEGDLRQTECPVDHKICPQDKCIFGGLGKKITAEFKNFLEATKLSDYAKKIKCI